jgi:uncharacterized protein YjgD (DUF1641 family)
MSAVRNVVMSAAISVKGGITAPPTMAMQMMPDPSAARGLRSSLARLKKLGT